MAKLNKLPSQQLYHKVVSEVKTHLVRPESKIDYLKHFETKFSSLNTPKQHLASKELEKYSQAEVILTYLEQNRKHKELLELYTIVKDDQDRVAMSAKRVGLSLPKIFGELEEAIKK